MVRALLLLTLVVAVTARDRYHPDHSRGSQRVLKNAAEADAQYWISDAQAKIAQYSASSPRAAGTHARNVIMFLGDGMSIPTLMAARTLLGQRRGETGEEAELAFEHFPTVGLAKTYCVDAQIADSACTATAYLCGVKTNRGTLGVTAAVPRYDCDASQITSRHVESIAEWALADGRDVGFVTTTRVTHASPAGLYAKSANRYWESDAEVVLDGYDTDRCPDIAHQLVHSYPGNQFKVILGGGRREFITNDTVDEEGYRGLRTDGRNIIREWENVKRARNVTHNYVWNRSQLMDLSNSPPEYLLGLFEGSHMRYNLEADNTTEPTLTELTEVAIRSLSRNERGFFLFVEGGRIDHAHHDNWPHLALDETIQMSEAVARAREMLSEEDTLFVVTADHSHVLAVNGYSLRGKDILGVSDDLDEHGVPYMTLSYTNGPGARVQREGGVRVDVTQDSNFRDLRWLVHVEVPLEDETHGGDDVAVFASGPHHELFVGLYEQSHVAHRMAYAACIGPGLHACSAGHTLRGSLLAALPLLTLALRFLLRYS